MQSMADKRQVRRTGLVPVWMFDQWQSYHTGLPGPLFVLIVEIISCSKLPMARGQGELT